MNHPRVLLVSDTPRANGLRQLVRQLAGYLKPLTPVTVYVGGDMASHLYLGDVVAVEQVDAEFSVRLQVPLHHTVDVGVEGGPQELMLWNISYNPHVRLLHSDYLQDSLETDLQCGQFHVRVMSPTDVAVSLIQRSSIDDLAVIKGLVRAGLTTRAEIEVRAREAMASFLGRRALLEVSLGAVLQAAADAVGETYVPPWETVLEQRPRA